MGSDRADKILAEAREKERRIDAALTVLETLKPDEAAFVYARLEKRVLSDASEGASSHDRSTITTAKSKKSVKKASAKKSTSAKSASLSSKVVQLLQTHPHGMRTYEIAKAIGRKSNATGALMRFLQDQGKAQRHGRRLRTLWTVPGATPIPRIITADDAILHLLDSGPMGSAKIEVEAKKLLLRETGSEVASISITSRFGKLLSAHHIVTHSADEHGPIYALVDTDDEGGDDDSPTIN